MLSMAYLCSDKDLIMQYRFFRWKCDISTNDNTITDSDLDDNIIGAQFKNMPENIQLVKDIKNKEIYSLKSSWNLVVNLVDEVKNSHIKTSIDAVV